MNACEGCGVVLPVADAKPHPYMTASPACWARFGELLAAQYASPERMAFHQLVVDAYAAQHPGNDDPRAVQSVAIHLMTLALMLEDGADPTLGPKLHKRMVSRPVFHRLTGRAPSPGDLTVADVPLDASPAETEEAVRAWAQDVWRSWAAQHAIVREWLVTSGLAPG